MTDLPKDERYIAAGTCGRFSVANPDEIKLTFGLTMTAPEWRHLARQLPTDGSAAGQVRKMIDHLLAHSQARFEAELETTGWSVPRPTETQP